MILGVIQVKTLQDRHTVQMQEEAVRHEARMESLRQGVASLFEDFSDRKIAAKDLMVRPIITPDLSCAKDDRGILMGSWDISLWCRM